MNSKQTEEPACNLSNAELIDRVEKWVHKLAETGGQAWTLRVPVDFNHDPDMLIIEVCKRFSASLPSKPVGDVEEMDRVIKFLALELPEPVWNDVNKKWQRFKSGYAAAPQKGMDIREKYKQWCKETKRNGSVLVGGSMQEFFNWLDESPSPSEAGDGWDDEDWIKFIQWYARMNRSSVLQGINQYKSQTPDQ